MGNANTTRVPYVNRQPNSSRPMLVGPRVAHVAFIVQYFSLLCIEFDAWSRTYRYRNAGGVAVHHRRTELFARVPQSGSGFKAFHVYLEEIESVDWAFTIGGIVKGIREKADQMVNSAM
jgi:hypothetical protein